jgi:hypothetical protein
LKISYRGGQMDPGGQTTGTRDVHYDLIGVLCQALRGAENCNTYALDAEASGRTDLYEFFCEAQATQTGLAERAKELLGISDAAPEKDTPSVTAAPSEDVAPPEEAVPPDVPSPPDEERPRLDPYRPDSPSLP